MSTDASGSSPKSGSFPATRCRANGYGLFRAEDAAGAGDAVGHSGETRLVFGGGSRVRSIESRGPFSRDEVGLRVKQVCWHSSADRSAFAVRLADGHD
jgi:hypothetical protein